VTSLRKRYLRRYCQRFRTDPVGSCNSVDVFPSSAVLELHRLQERRLIFQLQRLV
jgi:hypothetical protein